MMQLHFFSTHLESLCLMHFLISWIHLKLFWFLREKRNLRWIDICFPIHLFTIGLDKVGYSHFCFLKNASNRQIDLSSLVTSYMEQKRVLIRSLLLLTSAATLGKGKPRGEHLHFCSLTVSSRNDCMQESYS